MRSSHHMREINLDKKHVYRISTSECCISSYYILLCIAAIILNYHITLLLRGEVNAMQVPELTQNAWRHNQVE